MRYKLIIFDFDGTLADSVPWFTTVVNKLADQFSFRKIDESEHAHLRGLDSHKLMNHLKVPVWKIPMMAGYLRNLMARHIDEIPLFKGIDDMLRRLHQNGATLAIVSSNSLENAGSVLGAELSALLSDFETGVSLFGKELKLRRVLHKTKIPAQDAIYIGDEIRDIEAAHKVHLNFGAVTWGYNNRESLMARTPEECFESIADMTSKLLA